MAVLKGTMKGSLEIRAEYELEISEKRFDITSKELGEVFMRMNKIVAC
jgi:hypothetical protein